MELAAAVSKRNPQLDLLRGIAVLLVIADHYPYFDFFHRVGWAGVDLFFVLSGFLISGLLFSDWKKNGRLSIGRFFIRRGFKIYPPFYAFLLLTIPLVLRAHPPQMLRHYMAEGFFLQDYLHHLWPHTWSLAVEEQFYLLLPLLLLGLSQLRPSSPHRGFILIPVISLVLLAVCLQLRVQAFATETEELVFPLHFRADSLFVGVALGYLFHFHEAAFRRFSRWWLLPAGVVMLIPLVVFGRDVSALPYVFTSNALGFALLLWWILPRSRIRSRVVEKVGYHSYSIYLWHFPVTMVVAMLPLTFLTFCANIVASYFTGAFMSVVVEKRALALRDRLFPASEAVPVSTPQVQPTAVVAEPLARGV
jgi:peptidoglycan/LPS O-acetylase OafA/YrhL